MLRVISRQDLERLLLQDHPTWIADAITRQAEEYRLRLDERLEEPLRQYLQTGTPQEFSYGEFSLLFIQALRHGCSYFQAVTLMDAYLKDPLNGKALILRR